MFPITVTINSSEQLNAVMAALEVSNVESPQTTPVKSETKVKAAPAKKESPKVEEKPATPQPEVAANDPGPSLTNMGPDDAVKALHGHANRPADAPTYAEVVSAINALAKVKGREAAVSVLTEFGVTKGPELKPEQFADVIAACEVAGAAS